ncbi:hypothetical protein [Arthrobacter sp. ISL-30]|uniref:hypothetical protein n=1 Tax=Arthrobacter sp. ISL-30 TaxID=2819109 RepID=UPI001BEB40E6|nr:hypothetical protein [Arthrobacter sp. ISL-30]MBT2513528.1 hypothetical protein [Arthrobacter sp. ISL-30]
MKGKLMFGAGLAAGYVMWSRQGQAAFRKFKDQAGAVWRSPAVQHQVHDAAETVKHKAPEVVDKVAAAAKKATAAAGSIVPGSHDAQNKDSSRPDRRDDVIFDPSRKDASGHDWTDEGGATTSGTTTTGATTTGTTSGAATDADALRDRSRVEGGQ